MESLEFSKGHGTGNDFVIIPDPEGAVTLTPQLVSSLCDRRFGIGGDGVLRVVRTAAEPQPVGVVDPSLLGTAEWFMDYRNADGSLAETCGNGIRVFARYLVQAGLVATSEVTVATRAGTVVAVVSEDAVSVSMPLPRVYEKSVASVILPNRSAAAAGRDLPGLAVDAGNPHLVCPLPADLELAELDLTAPPQVDPEMFPDGVNVELTAALPGATGASAGSGAPQAAEPAGDDHHLRMRVHERGVGETPSCGSGACAAAAATLHAAGRASGVVTVDVPGGRLLVSLTGEGCALTGPAVLVAHGTVQVAALR